MPYLFMNTDQDIVKINEKTPQKELKWYNMMLTEPEAKVEFKLNSQFCELYMGLLDAISSNNSDKIDQICEKRLAEKLKNGVKSV